jgi:MOSC domain-containing protein YiiM
VHLPFDELVARLRELPPPPREGGRVALVVVRPAVDARALAARTALTAAGGLAGDRWALRPDPRPENQVTMIRADIARLVADGQPAELCGDNLHVELDLSLENLPAGTRLAIGTALCEVTPKPHTGCGKFARRFGRDALAFANAAAHASLRLRGLHVRVLEDGEVAPGDAIRVVARPGRA